MQYLHILSFLLYICIYSFKYLQILHIGVKAMNKNTRQIKPLGRSTKEEKAGLSLPTPQLFSVVGDAFKYYNEFTQTLSKSSSDFIFRLISKKFIHAQLPFSFYHGKKYCSVRTFNKDLSSCRNLNIYWIF